METNLNEILHALDKSDVLTRVEIYESLSGHPSDYVEALLRDAIAREQNELARAYMVLLWAELRKNIGEDMDEALVFLHELEHREEIYKSERCMISCYYAEHLFGNQSATRQVENILDSSDECVRNGATYLLDDMKSGYAM